MIKILASTMIIVVSVIQVFETEIKIFVSMVESCFNVIFKYLFQYPTLNYNFK